MKKPKTMEDFRACALACLDLATDAYVELNALPKGKPFPKTLKKKYLHFVFRACRNWAEYRIRHTQKIMSERQPLQSGWIGKVKTDTWPEGKTHTHDKIHMTLAGQWEKVTPKTKGRPGKPFHPDPGTFKACGMTVKTVKHRKK